MSVSLLRPVPVATLHIGTTVRRSGRKLQVIDISLSAGGVEVARAEGIRIRTADPDLEPALLERPLDHPQPEQSFEIIGGPRIVCPFLAGVSTRLTDGPTRRIGPSSMWFRLDQSIAEGEANTPAMMAAVAGDFCNGVSSPLDISKWTFVNADMSISLARMPRGEWILVDAETWLGPDGVGIAFAKLADTDGYFGRANQTLVVERRASKTHSS
jgi:hypothetical protein